MPLADYHVHTPLCRHATGELHEYVAAARAAGLDELGFSDHVPLPGGFDADQRMAGAELPRYLELVAAARRRHPDYPIRLGLEADYRPEFAPHVREVLAAHEWDYVLGAVHHLAEWGFDNPRQRGEWDRRDVLVAWREYFTLLAQAAASGLCDVLAHFDLPKVFGFRPPPEVTLELARPALEAAARHGVAIEVSTGGLRKPCREIYPAPELLAEAHAFGLPVTLGSDAHRPADVAADFEKAVALLRRVGYSSYLLFAGRRRREVPLPAIAPRR